MDQSIRREPLQHSAAHLTRRVVLQSTACGLAARVLTSQSGADGAAAHMETSTPVAHSDPTAPVSDAILRAFETDVEDAMTTFQMPGAAVVLVQGNEIVFSRGFGLRDVESGEPVTPRTRFRIGSITKSMTVLALATLVDEGVLSWDDRAVDLWPSFKALTDELTETLRLRDLLGMASGLAESPDMTVAAVEFFMSAGETSARDVLRSVADLPVIAPPHTAFSYNNTLYAAAAFLGLLAQHEALDGLEEKYAAQIRQRVFDPIGMVDAAIIDDPRPLGDDFAVGYTHDIFGNLSPLPFVSIAGIAPAGSGLASATDMAHYVITQMQGGVAPDGSRVVSAKNLAEMHKPGITIEPGSLFPPDFQPDTTSLHYAMGWLVERFRDGRELIWHSGGIDGFSATVGFLPEEQFGYAVLTNLGRGGGLFYLSVQASLLGRMFGLNQKLPGFLANFIPGLRARTAELAATTSPVDPAVVAPYLGLYEKGFQLRLDDDGALYLDHDIRSLPLLALPDGTYVVADGPEVVLEQLVTLTIDPAGTPVLTMQGFNPVRWLTGG